MSIVNTTGRAPYQSGDDTRNWVEQVGRVDGKLKPAFLARIATDTNYVRHANINLYGGGTQRVKSMMNLGLPGQRLPGVINWSVTEGLDTPVQSATLEMYNCLYVSTTETTLSSYLPADPHGRLVVANWAFDSMGTLRKLQGNATNQTAYFPGTNSVGAGASTVNNTNVTALADSHGYKYREDNVKYRMFAPTVFDVASSTGFPNPAIPNDDDNDIPDSPWWTNSNAGSGSYYVQIDNEIIRVVALSGNRFTIPPGGRGVGSAIVAHNPGAKIKLLGYGQPTGNWTALGYQNVDDWTPEKCLFRPGTCITTYEGYGQLPTLLSHSTSRTRNYHFTGYWYIVGAEPSMDSSGIPKIRLDLRSAGYMLEKQKITPDILRRAKTQFGQWQIGGSSIWGAADHDRNIPGDWVDYDSWDPSLATSYPLQIKTELAQHKAFYDHMRETQTGAQCEICREELKSWRTEHPNNKNAVSEQRAVGRHIYKESIRVIREEAGPQKTFIRLMATLAMAAWDHPAYGTQLAQSFTKIPNKLFTRMRTIDGTGLVFKGQMYFQSADGDGAEDWFTPTYQDEQVTLTVRQVTCPFESTYDKTPFYQPMLDVAEINGNVFWITRLGYPVFKPRLLSMRPPGEQSEWFQQFGASIDGCSTNVSAESIVTQAWVTATSAFGSDLTVLAGGTGVDTSGNVKTFSPLGGNSQGLALTGGVQQVETLALDNQVLGLDWNTKPAYYGTAELRDSDGIKIVNALPEVYEGQVTLGPTGTPAANAKKHPTWVRRVERTINWMNTRSYINVNSTDSNGTWGSKTTAGVVAIRNYLVAQGIAGATAGNTWDKATGTAFKNWVKTRDHYIKFDIWWYAINRTDTGWEEYLSAVTGVPITTKKTDMSNDSDTQYAVDDIATQKQVGNWTKSFSKQLVNVGNRLVDDSINKAVARTISSNFADPRILPGDVLWADIPGFLRVSTKPPFTNGIYVTNIQRTLDLQNATYTATYSGHRYIGAFAVGWGTKEMKDRYL